MQMIKLEVKNNQLTYDKFSEIFSFLLKKEQYEIANILEDNNVELVDYISKANCQTKDSINEESDNETIINIFEDDTEEDSEVAALFDESIFKDSNATNSSSDQLLYYKKITQTNEMLCRLIQEGNQQAKQDLCVKNKLLVMKIALRYEKYYNSDLDLEDLTQAGYLGMIIAAERFDHSMENSFSTYAVHWIRQSISREIMDKGALIRIPVHKYELINKISRIDNELSMDNIPFDTRISKIADLVDKKEEDVIECFVIKNNFLRYSSLNTFVGDDESSELGEFIPDEEQYTLEDLVVYKSLVDDVERALDTITEREKEIIRLRFGLEDGREHTLEEIGKVFHVTRERIRQIEAKALRRLRHPTRSRKLRDYLYE